jgi:hypothetical protein
MSETEKVVAELRERTAFRFAGDCKCGKCQLVPRELVDRAADLLAHQSARLEEVAGAIGGFTNVTGGDLAHAVDLISLRCATAENAAADLRGRLTAAEAEKESAHGVLRKFLDFADADYVPNTLFDRARAALSEKERTDV